MLLLLKLLCKKKYKCDKHIKHFSGIPGILYNYTILYSFIQKKWSFPLRISSVNVTKSAVSCEFGHIYWRNS